MAKIIITIEDAGKNVEIETSGDTEIERNRPTPAQRVAKLMEKLGYGNINNTV